MEKRWVKKVTPPSDLVSELARSLSVTDTVTSVKETIAAILCQRNICTYQEAKAYFRPSLDHLHDPFLMQDMDKAINRLNEAMQRGEKILIYGDYDVDGTTSVAMAYKYLEPHFQGRIGYYIPNRYTEGYGVSVEGMDWAAENGYSLIISLDCGIKALENVAYAKSMGVDFIICDHHLPDEQLPVAVAVLDPKRPDCHYPYKDLSGCGVGFKLLQAFCKHNNLDPEGLNELLDLVVVSIAADIVPITGENRVLAHFGLKKLNEGDMCPGLEALKEMAGLKDEIDINTIVFGFAPRINAAGRMGDAKRSVAMLLAKDKDEAFAEAASINQSNDSRRLHDSNTTREALQMISEDEVLRNANSTVLYKEDWNKGVVGIVASRCIEKYYRPTIILTKSNGLATGSARSVPGFDVHSAIMQCADLLEQYGGHMYAAGLTMKLENVPAFQEKFEQIVTQNLKAEQRIPLIEIDMPLRFNQITPAFFDIINQMRPFGPGNMAPVFSSECVYDMGSCRVVGDSHLKLKLMQEDSGPIDAIAFGLAEHYPLIQKGIPFDVCYSVEQNVFRGTSALQLRIKDIRFPID